MQVSVVMTTYNGQKFLREQLQSIVSQTVQPDEVLIFDDGSTDGTVSIAEDFIRAYALPWKITVNPENYGWQKNFMQGIEKAGGDIVFLADQDDIWNPNKIAYMVKALRECPEANLAICEYVQTPENTGGYLQTESFLNPTAEFDCYRYTPRTIHIVRPGCTYAFRKVFFDRIKSAWCPELPHDMLIYMGAWMDKSIVHCKGQLHCFRRHEGANSLRPPAFDADIRLARNTQQRYAYASLMKILGPSSRGVKRLGKWLELRESLLKDKDPVAAVKLTGYLGYYRTFKTWGVDCLCLFQR